MKRTRRVFLPQLLMNLEQDVAQTPYLSPQTLPAVVQQTAEDVRDVMDRINLGEHAVALRRKQHRLFNPVA